jgi:PadR family transcriptional regulator, regulatory protein PadR
MRITEFAKHWVSQTESNQRANYYRLTAAGKKQLAADHTRWQWQQMVEAITAIMQPAAGAGES